MAPAARSSHRTASSTAASTEQAGRALAVPGFAPDSDWTTSKVQKVTGGRVIQTLDAWMRVTLGDRRPTMPVLGIDARDPLARGMTELVSGRWASTPSEIVVTEAGIAGGLPRQGNTDDHRSGRQTAAADRGRRGHRPRPELGCPSSSSHCRAGHRRCGPATGTVGLPRRTGRPGDLVGRAPDERLRTAGPEPPGLPEPAVSDRAGSAGRAGCL